MDRFEWSHSRGAFDITHYKLADGISMPLDSKSNEVSERAASAKPLIGAQARHEIDNEARANHLIIAFDPALGDRVMHT